MSEVRDIPGANDLSPLKVKVAATVDKIAERINGTDVESATPLAFWEQAKERGTAFKKKHEQEALQRAPLDAVKLQFSLSDWVRTDALSGNPLLSQVGEALIQLWDKIESPGHPAHDKRHVMEDLQTEMGYEKVLSDAGSKDAATLAGAASIAGMTHDIGRLAEVRATGELVGGEAGREHPNASFVILQDVLDQFPGIPQSLRDQLCYAVLVHQSWLSDQDAPNYNLIMNGLVERFVMGADRQQLLGPEGVRRFLQFDVGMSTREIVATPDESKKTALDPRQQPPLSLPHHTEYYMRTHRPVAIALMPIDESWPEDVKGRVTVENAAITQANERVDERTRWLESVSGTFVWLGWPHLREEVFAPEQEVDARDAKESGSGQQWREAQEERYRKREKNFLKPETWELIKKQTHDATTNGIELNTKIKDKLRHATEQRDKTLDELAEELVTAPHVAVDSGELETIKSKITSVTGDEARLGLMTAFGYALVMSDELSSHHNDTMQAILTNKDRYPENGLEHRFAKFASSSERKAAG